MKPPLSWEPDDFDTLKHCNVVIQLRKILQGSDNVIDPLPAAMASSGVTVNRHHNIAGMSNMSPSGC